MSLTESIEELIVSKYLCESSTLNFTRYFFKHRFGRKFIASEHHIKICEALDKVISGEIKKLIINIAPRYGKTELAVKNFMAYGLAINPSSRFIHLSYSDDLALDNSEEVKEIVKSEEYQQMFSKVQVKPKSDSKKKWYTSEQGGVYATSTAGQVTGFGAGVVDLEEEIDLNFLENSTGTFAGALIIDDPIKPEDADSMVTRNRINERWDSTIKNRVNSRNTPIIIIMQRLHEEDLCGYLINQAPDDWTILSFPSIKPDGTALWPFKHTLEELIKLRNENELVFDRQHMQDPKTSKGILFNRKELNRFSLADLTNDGLETTLGYCDVKDEGIDNLSFPFAKIYKGKVFIHDVVFSNATVEQTLPQSAAKILEHKVNYVRVEKNNQGSGFIRDLRKLVPAEKVLSVNNTVSKLSRVWNEYGFIMKYVYFLEDADIIPGSDYDKFLRNVCSFMKDGSSKVDDGADSLAGLTRFIQVMPATAKLFM